MHIRSLHQTYPAPAAHEHTPSRSDARLHDDAARPPLRIIRDRVAISSRARTLLDELRRAPDVDLSISALLEKEPLPDVRATEVLDRIEDGFYAQPAVVEELANVLGSVLEAES